jgi:hypothetical protein
MALAQTNTPDPLTTRFMRAGAEARDDGWLDELYGKLPLMFEANRGQSDEKVKFISRGNGYSLFLTSSEAVLALADRSSSAPRPGAVLRMTLPGSSASPVIEGLGEAGGKSNYLTGGDPGKWRTDIPSFARVKYRDVYPGVDVVYYGSQSRLEYDFIVAPGADPVAITLAYEGADKIELDGSGDLLLHTAAGTVRQRRPVIYQQSGGERIEVRGGYLAKGKGRVGFELNGYDPAKPLIIDPVLVYSTLMGGNDQFREIDRAGDKGLSIAIDGAGNAYITGETFSSDFPAPGPIQARHGGSFADAFVAKLNAAGTALIYSTYLGGTGRDSGNDIAVDSMGQASVIGTTRSPNFPTANALQPTSNLDAEPFLQKAFVTKLNALGNGLIFSTYLAGDGSSSGEGIATDSSGNIYTTGATDPANFPFTPGAFQSTGFSSGAFVTKLNPIGSALVYSAFIGGGLPDSLALDPSGNTYITGRTFTTSFPTTLGSFMPVVDGDSLFYSFVTKLNSAGSALAYSTFIGDDVADMTTGIAVDSSGNAFLTGLTTTFPTTPAAFATLIGTGGSLDGFVRKLNPSGSAFIYSTNFGGSNVEVSNDVAVDGAGNAYVTGLTFSSDYPLVSPLQTRRASIFAAKLNPTGTAFVYSTFFGGSVFNEFEMGSAIAVDPAGSAYFTGIAEQTDFPTTPGALQRDRRGITDAFVAKIASFDACLEDESSGDILLFDTVTGNYQFISCRSGVTLAGTGRITGKGCLIVIEESQGDHRVNARLDTCQGKGTASVRSLPGNQSFVLTDRNTADNTCRCR